MRGETVIETQWHYAGLREVSVQAQSNYRCVYTAVICVTWAHQRRSRGAVEDLTALSRWPHSVSTAYLSERRTMARTLCMFKVRTVVKRSTMFLVIPPRQIKMPVRCNAAVGDSNASTLIGVLHYLRTQKDRLEDALRTQPRCYKVFNRPHSQPTRMYRTQKRSKVGCVIDTNISHKNW